MPTYAELQEQAEPARRRIEALDCPRVAVGVDTSSIARAALETLAAIRAEVESRGLDVAVDQVGGNGLSFANPLVMVRKPGGETVLYQHLTADAVPAFVEAVLVRGEPGADWALGVLEGDERGLPRMEDHAWWSVQDRRLMQDMGVGDPGQIDDAIALGAYSGLERSMTMTQEEVIAEISGSKLGGRSGGFFPTGRKWDFLRTSPANPKTIVCNADEGDPGAWVNRMTMENDPHALLEGMTIAAYATGATRGYIYIREEYPLAHERLLRAVDQARDKGLLGDQVLGRDFAFDIKVVRGAGSYVCGEESGLIASVEDARGMPKIRPPYPAVSGVFGQGSNVNNVESYHCATWIMRNGVEKWADTGSERNPGTMMFTLSGAVQRVGCFEVPFGLTVRQIYEVCGGGPEEGRTFKALQPGGPLLGVVPEFALDLTNEPESFREKKAAGLGGGGFVFLDDTACVVDLCSAFEVFMEDESCGRCKTCQGGTQRMVEILRRVQRGGGRESDVAKIHLLASTLPYSNCFHGQFATTVIANTLDWFRDEFDVHLLDRRCPAKVCNGLIRYVISDQAGDLPKAADYCPTGAIKQGTDGWYIDDVLCVRCDTCREIAPEAVEVVDRFLPGQEPPSEDEEPALLTPRATPNSWVLPASL